MESTVPLTSAYELHLRKLIIEAKYDEALALEHEAFFRAIKEDLSKQQEIISATEAAWIDCFYNSRQLFSFERIIATTKEPRLAGIIHSYSSHVRSLKRVVITSLNNLRLANTISLFEILNRLPEDEKKSTAVWILSPAPTPAEILQLKIQTNVEFICINQLSPFVSTFVLAHLLRASDCQELSICFWSVPLHLPFAFSVMRSLLPRSTKLCHFPTKHGFCFREELIDTHIGISSKSFNRRTDSHKIVPPLPYPATSLAPPQQYSQSEERLIESLQTLKSKGFLIVSSLCRWQKIDNDLFMSVVNEMLSRNAHIVYVSFIKDSDKADFFRHAKNTHRLTSNRFLACPWMNRINSVVSLLDIYLDPFPLGGGYSLELAMRNSVATIIPVDDCIGKEGSAGPRREFANVSRLLDNKLLNELLFPSEPKDIPAIVEHLSTSRALLENARNYSFSIWERMEKLRLATNSLEYITP
jgi:hypothetical protein